MTHVESFFFGVFVSLLVFGVTTICLMSGFNEDLRLVGIKEIVHCEVHTATVQSNWCEIVWMDGYGDKARKEK